MSGVPLAKQMQQLTRKRRLELRQSYLDKSLEGLPESPVKRRRALLLGKYVPELVVAITDQIRADAEADGTTSLTVCRRIEPDKRGSKAQACCFYLSCTPDSKEVFRCDAADEEYVVDTVIEAMLDEEFSVDRFPPTPRSPMPVFRINWYNLGLTK